VSKNTQQSLHRVHSRKNQAVQAGSAPLTTNNQLLLQFFIEPAIQQKSGCGDAEREAPRATNITGMTRSHPRKMGLCAVAAGCARETNGSALVLCFLKKVHMVFKCTFQATG
jgi:hypothetical protein